jgi:hypothetical protein
MSWPLIRPPPCAAPNMPCDAARPRFWRRPKHASSSTASAPELWSACATPCQRSAVRGITLESLEIETDGEIDLRGFLGIDPAVPPGYENLSYIVRIKGKRHQGGVRRGPRGGYGDLAQLLQRISARCPQTGPGRRVIAG